MWKRLLWVRRQRSYGADSIASSLPFCLSLSHVWPIVGFIVVWRCDDKSRRKRKRKRKKGVTHGKEKQKLSTPRYPSFAAVGARTFVHVGIPLTLATIQYLQAMKSRNTNGKEKRKRRRCVARSRLMARCVHREQKGGDLCFLDAAGVQPP